MDELENVWITSEIGDKIRGARVDRGMSQLELAERVNASQQQIAGYEKGEKDMPVSRLFEIAQLLGLTAADLLTDDKSR